MARGRSTAGRGACHRRLDTPGTNLRDLADRAVAVSDAAERAAETVREHLTGSGAEWVESSPGRFSVELPGERKLKTSCSLAVREHSLVVNAFVARHPDENPDMDEERLARHGGVSE